MQFPYTSCNELILSYQKHDDGKGWTLTCIMATGKTILGCFRRYLAAWPLCNSRKSNCSK